MCYANKYLMRAVELSDEHKLPIVCTTKKFTLYEGRAADPCEPYIGCICNAFYMEAFVKCEADKDIIIETLEASDIDFDEENISDEELLRLYNQLDWERAVILPIEP